MYRYFSISLLLFCISANAEIYKYVDEDGKIFYSDSEIPGATQVELSKTVTFTPKAIPPTPNKTKKAKQDKTVSYSQVAITKPSMNETIRNKTGNVAVVISLTPPLQSGDTITLYLDGKETSKGLTQTSTTLNNLNFGSHTLKASVRNSKGGTLINSTSVIFHLVYEVTVQSTNNNNTNNSNAYKPNYTKDDSEEVDYSKDYSADYSKDFSADYDSSGSYDSGTKYNSSSSSSNNYKSNSSTYAPNYNQE